MSGPASSAPQACPHPWSYSRGRPQGASRLGLTHVPKLRDVEYETVGKDEAQRSELSELVKT
jgi:hypothetical protein